MDLFLPGVQLNVNNYCPSFYRAESADLKILIADSSLLSLSFVRDSIHTQTTPTELARHLLHPHSLGEAVFNEDDTIVVLNKTDLLSHDLGLQYSGNGLKVCPLSCKTEEGVGGFLGQLKSILEKMSVCILCC